jgi:hypothetical protein
VDSAEEISGSAVAVRRRPHLDQLGGVPLVNHKAAKLVGLELTAVAQPPDGKWRAVQRDLFRVGQQPGAVT